MNTTDLVATINRVSAHIEAVRAAFATITGTPPPAIVDSAGYELLSMERTLTELLAKLRDSTESDRPPWLPPKRST